MTVDANMLVQVIGTREALGAVVNGAFEWLLEGVDGTNVALEVLGALEDLAAVVEAALENLAARVVGVAGDAAAAGAFGCADCGGCGRGDGAGGHEEERGFGIFEAVDGVEVVQA